MKSELHTLPNYAVTTVVHIGGLDIIMCLDTNQIHVDLFFQCATRYQRKQYYETNIPQSEMLSGNWVSKPWGHAQHTARHCTTWLDGHHLPAQSAMIPGLRAQIKKTRIRRSILLHVYTFTRWRCFVTLYWNSYFWAHKHTKARTWHCRQKTKQSNKSFCMAISKIPGHAVQVKTNVYN